MPSGRRSSRGGINQRTSRSTSLSPTLPTEASREDTKARCNTSQVQSNQPLPEQQGKDGTGTRKPATTTISKTKPARRPRYDDSSMVVQRGSTQSLEGSVHTRHICGIQVDLVLTQVTRDRLYVPPTDELADDDLTYSLVICDHHPSPDHGTVSELFDQGEVSLQWWLNSTEDPWNPLMSQR